MKDQVFFMQIVIDMNCQKSKTVALKPYERSSVFYANCNRHEVPKKQNCSTKTLRTQVLSIVVTRIGRIK